MTRILDLLERDFSLPVEETVEVAPGEVSPDDPDTAFTELTEYVATGHIRQEYERLLEAMAVAPKTQIEDTGIWISGFFGSGKSAFAQNLALALANRHMRGSSAGALFLRQLESTRVPAADLRVAARAAAGFVQQLGSTRVGALLDILHRTIPCEAFLCDMRRSNQPLAEVMDRALRRELNVPDDNAVADTSVEGLIQKSFELCRIHRPGKTFLFVLDEIGGYLAGRGERLDELSAITGQFAKESWRRVQAGLIPGPVWIMVTAEDKPGVVHQRAPGAGVDPAAFENRFPHQIELTTGDIREAALYRVLRKKRNEEPVLRKLFRDRGSTLKENVKLERSSCQIDFSPDFSPDFSTDFSEDEFVESYPYLPHFIDLSLEILASIRRQPNSAEFLCSGNRTIVKQFAEMLVSEETVIGDQPVGALVSIDKIYDLVGGNIAWEKQIGVLEIGQRLDGEIYFPGMASRVAKAICLMQFVKSGLPRTAGNIATLLIQRVSEVPPLLPVQVTLARLKAEMLARETEDGWSLYDFDELRETTVWLEAVRTAVGSSNPRGPGWHNRLIATSQRWVARARTWYTRQHEFKAGVHQSLQQLVSALDRLSMNMVTLEQRSKKMISQERRQIALEFAPLVGEHLAPNMDAFDHLAMDTIALSGRLSQSEKRIEELERTIQEQLAMFREQVRAPDDSTRHGTRQGARPSEHRPGADRTAYVIGLFGSGRDYVNRLIQTSLGERAQHFRDTIRLHPGPTPMIYSGHATTKYISCFQASPAVTGRILEGVHAGFADLLFVYRHPLDSLLTNWVWWRTHLRESRWISGISEEYPDVNDLCADLDRNFSDFQAFAQGDPNFFAGEPGPRFLSFTEFVEETALHLRSATLPLRLEDFIEDSRREFTKIAGLLSPDLGLNGSSIAPPKTKPYRHWVVKERVPRFREFVDCLDGSTKRRIETIGYPAI